jgi:hypothetical protein
LEDSCVRRQSRLPSKSSNPENLKPPTAKPRSGASWTSHLIRTHLRRKTRESRRPFPAKRPTLISARLPHSPRLHQAEDRAES